MANQRHKDKVMVGWYAWKCDKADLKNNAKMHNVPMSVIYKAITANYLNLKKSQQAKLLNAIDCG